MGSVQSLKAPGSKCMKEIGPSPPPTTDMYSRLRAQSCFSTIRPPTTSYPFQGPSLPSEDTEPLWMSVPRTLHGWPDSLGSNFTSNPSCRRAGGSGGWESTHGGTLQLLPAAPRCRSPPIGTRSASAQPASPVDLINKAVIRKGQKTSHSDEATERTNS